MQRWWSTTSSDRTIENASMEFTEASNQEEKKEVVEEHADESDAEENEDESEEEEHDEQQWMGVDVIPSLCMRCGDTGETRLKLHDIPYFRKVLLMSFSCDHCGEANNEVSFGGEIQAQGVQYSLTVVRPEDLDRQLIKSDSATLLIPSLQFEIPPGTQKGEISTLEGFLKTAATNLAAFQDEREKEQPEVFAKVAEIVNALQSMASGELLPFDIVLRDPAGNSYIQNPMAPLPDPRMKSHRFHRSAEESIALGLDPNQLTGTLEGESDYQGLLKDNRRFGEAPAAESEVAEDPHFVETDDSVALGRKEVIRLPSQCPNCGAEGDAMTAITDIPHFKEVIIMAFDCGMCGFRNNEVKGGGAVPKLGTQVTLTVANEEDLKRDCLKSDSCEVLVPELDLVLTSGTLGGVYSTVEGLLSKIRHSLRDQVPFVHGDSYNLHHSANPEVLKTRERFDIFLEKLDAYSKAQNLPFTLILRDPLGNSYISPPLGSFLPPEMDSKLKIEDFERTFEENEDLGLNDINTKDFEVIPDSAYQGPAQLPDRLTHITKKSSDHPTPFAKGTYDHDNTVGALPSTVVNTNGNSSNGNGSTAQSQEYYQGPKGYVFARMNDQGVVELPENHTDVVDNEAVDVSTDEPTFASKRTFELDDLQLTFTPYEEFSGARPGMVFRLGAQGLGYYQDVPKL